jgi:hypothetical protein
MLLTPGLRGILGLPGPSYIGRFMDQVKLARPWSEADRRPP